MSPRKKISRPLRRIICSFQALFRALFRLLKQAISSFLHLIRRQLITRNQQRNRWLPTRGFVLPTTILVLLVVGLFSVALIQRSGDRAEDVIRSRETERIDSIAEPAVDRAKAKIEELFTGNNDLEPVPAEESLSNELSKDLYKFDGETRIDIDNADGDDDATTGVDNAWTYTTDLDGDGTNERVAYSILVEKENNGTSLDGNVTDKANNLVTRAGPINIEPTTGPTAECDIPTRQADRPGWFQVNATSLRTNFQVNVFVESQNEANQAVTALEYQQDRQIDQGNRFGVWFRYDLLIHPGPPFRLNGAIHTDGNLVTWNDSLRFYLVSSPASCIYSEGANEIELTEIIKEEELPDGETVQITAFQSQAISADGSTEEVDLFNPDGPSSSEQNRPFKPETDSIQENINNVSDFYEYTLDPLKLYTENKLVSRGKQKSNSFNDGDGSYDVENARDPDWNTYDVSKRILNENQLEPYVDDFYRADDRWGPKPTYGRAADTAIKDIPANNGDIIGSNPNPPEGFDQDTYSQEKAPAGALQEVGLDGYWERRAYDQGLRIIVGERLDLGNAFGWQGSGNDPLNPIVNTPTGARPNEQRQLKSLRDNLAAVQGTAVYHHNDDGDEGGQDNVGAGDFPVATIATTAHPGTQETVTDSTTFEEETFNNGNSDITFTVTNFLEGEGTNGWEFNAPGNVDTDAEFANIINNADSPLRRALSNLAYFAGDPNGAFPPTQENAGGSGIISNAGPETHPYPQLTMWGDYSDLRRIIERLDGDDTYSDLSLAEKTTLHTAATDLGMLAYYIDKLQQFNYGANSAVISTAGPLNDINDALARLGDGNQSNGEVAFFPTEDLNGNGNDDDTVGGVSEDLDGDSANNAIPNVAVFDNNGNVIARSRTEDLPGKPTSPPPEFYLTGLQALADAGVGSIDDDIVETARIIHLKEQVERDRRFGFNGAFLGKPDDGDTTTDRNLNGAYRYGVNERGGTGTNTNEDLNGNGLLNNGGANPLTQEWYPQGFAGAGGATRGGPQCGSVPTLGASIPNNISEDLNNNGVLDHNLNEDLNGNGVFDTTSSDELISEDFNNDGVFNNGTAGQPYLKSEDLNNNGVLDPDEDFNGNGRLDFTETEDLNDNGVLDSGEDFIIPNGTLDTTDLDGDGATNTVVTEDLNGDGNFNDGNANPLLSEDLNCDGVFGTNLSEDYNTNESLDDASSSISPDQNGDSNFTNFNEDSDSDGNLDRGFVYSGKRYEQNAIADIGFDFNTGSRNNFFGLGEPTTTGDEETFLRLATALRTTQPKFPSLHYLFPVVEHAHDGEASGTAAGAATYANPTVNQENKEPGGDGESYVTDNYIFDRDSETGVNWDDEDDLYQVVQDTDGSGTEDREDANNNGTLDNAGTDTSEDLNGDGNLDTENGISAIALQPRNRDNWVLPYTTSEPSSSADDAATLTDSAINEINDNTGDNSTSVYLPFLDKGMYNGRQQMSVRVLNIDLGILRDNDGLSNETITNDNVNGESWLSNSGIVYAFREDSTREDGIARPNEETWSNCNTEESLTNTSNSCYMDPDIPRDPPKQDANNVSPKPVDYIADPARRPNGFRLSNGSQLGRVDTRSNAIPRGLSFITDNPAYFLGDFNLHSREEFQENLQDDYSNFYSRTDLDTGFAEADPTDPDNSDNDDWRPTEVLADALTFLSNSHCDGVIENAIQANNDGCDGTASYRNIKLDDSGGGNSSGSSWERENPSNPNSPIAVNRDAELLFDGDSTYNDLFGTNTVQELNDSDETTVNSVIVQGLSPTRENETYGGLHNFPRFNEDWSTDLNIDGSLIQLNFSNYDTANLDQQDTFQPASSATSGNDFPFYSPPNRKWGYDPALQYNPPGPIVERLLSNTGVRSEIYQELEVSDPYIKNLRDALDNL